MEYFEITWKPQAESRFFLFFHPVNIIKNYCKRFPTMARDGWKELETIRAVFLQNKFRLELALTWILRQSSQKSDTIEKEGESWESTSMVGTRAYLECLSLIFIYKGVKVESEKAESHFGPLELYGACLYSMHNRQERWCDVGIVSVQLASGMV